MLFHFLSYAKQSFGLFYYFYSETKKTILPSASSILLNGNNTGQVFNNPYKKAETDQIASLEKHVKMVRSIFFVGLFRCFSLRLTIVILLECLNCFPKILLIFINVCFNLEIHIQVDTDANTHMKNGKKICWNYRKGRCRFGSNCSFAHDSDLHESEPTGTDKDSIKLPSSGIGVSKSSNITSKSTNKKRSGLGDSIIPSKKVIKAYNALKK